MNVIDLHMHSSYSADGEFSPSQLMALCAQHGVKTAAIADHNSTRGVLEGMRAAEKLGILCIPAVELDCTHLGTNLHLLGYFIDPGFPVIAQLEAQVLKQEQEASQKRMELVQAAGIVFDTGEALRLSRDGVVLGETIAEAALSIPENRNNPLLAPYFPGGSRSDNPLVNFYWDFCSQGKTADVPLYYISLEEALRTIHAAGGIAVLAHPGNNVKENLPLLQDIIRQGIEGIEVFSSYHTQQQTAFYFEQASKHHLEMTCGSDFHGKTKPKILPGSIDCPERIHTRIKLLLENHCKA
ncbi:PHP domain-containing protein [Candidatus Soleaferrea massiliensis]|uniref:PHP domain-containing protein n=1 Tax=Candidatus Soleaferrea massiliensis TaxID=1470354 RepID=UPI00059052C6|nr:PHP domain-containing protein [Candidatus Soleaferrea massiliensis]